MTGELKFRGGGQIGRLRSSWPFVTLTVNRDRLVLNVPLVGTCTFEPKDIVAIEPIPDLLSRGLRIRHRVAACKENVEFLTFRDPRAIIEAIRQTGFPIVAISEPPENRFPRKLL